MAEEREPTHGEMVPLWQRHYYLLFAKNKSDFKDDFVLVLMGLDLYF